MTHVPQPPGHREKHYPAAAARPTVQPNPEVRVTDKLPTKVLYGPRGDVIAKHDPNPPVGFGR